MFFDNSTKAKKEHNKIIEERIRIKINYNFDWTESNKRELFFLQLKRDWDFYKVNKFYSKKDAIKIEEDIINKAKVKIKWKINAGYLWKDIDIGLYNEKGESLFSDYTSNKGNFTINLEGFREKIKLDKNYYLIYWKDWDVNEWEIGFLYRAKPYKFKSYLELIEVFKAEISLGIEENKKDKPITEGIPYVFIIFLIIIYVSFFYFFIVKKLIKKIFIHPFNRKHEIVYRKRRDIILNLRKKGLWKKTY